TLMVLIIDEAPNKASHKQETRARNMFSSAVTTNYQTQQIRAECSMLSSLRMQTYSYFPPFLFFTFTPFSPT
ncbi:hypothetical protein HN873_063432, partial [Arachis hypogaea]